MPRPVNTPRSGHAPSCHVPEERAQNGGWVSGWWWAPAPAGRLAVLRILVAGYSAVWLVARMPEHLSLADQPGARWDPVGPLRLWDTPPPDGLVVGSALVAPLVAVAVTAGWRHRITGPLWAATLLLVTSLASSWGQIFHTENLLVLHAAVLAVTPAADAFSLDARQRPVPEPDARYGWAVRLAAVLTVATYVLAGWAKLRIAGLDWAGGDVLRNLVAHDNLRKALLGDVHSPLGAAAVRHGWLFPPMAVLTLAVELGAPLALLHRTLRRVWVAAAWAFHLGVLALMAVLFPYPLAGVAFAPMFELERLPGWVSARLPARARPALGARHSSP